ncbi:MAG: RDD family protein [Bacilli bacterium]|nr:RDD family protein [Bacilli bacterium]MDD4065381.1 RDD family protein [Bacilli bacterium]
MKANFQARFVCYCFDYAIMFLLSFGLVRLFGFRLPFAAYLAYYFTPIRFYAIILYFFYILICFAFFKGVSLGGIIFNVRVVNEDNSKMPFGKCVIRSLLQTAFPLAVFNVPYMLIYRTQISLFDACSNSKTTKIRNR